LYIRFKEVEL